MSPVLAMRWTVGEASPRTVEALERSMASVRAAFGPAARLAVCVHSVPVGEVRAQARSAEARRATWLDVERDLPVFVRRRVDLSIAGGLAWRFAPLRVFGGRPEILLATDCLVAPFARDLARWASTLGQRRCLLAAVPAPGRRGRGAGRAFTLAARGVPASFDLEHALETALERGPPLLESAEDVIAAEVAALSCGEPPIVVDARGRVPHGAAAHPAIP